MRRFELPSIQSVVSPRIGATLSEAIGRPAQLAPYPYVAQLMQSFFTPADAVALDQSGQNVYSGMQRGVQNAAQMYAKAGEGIAGAGRALGAGILAAGKNAREDRRLQAIEKRRAEAEAKAERIRQNQVKAYSSMLEKTGDPKWAEKIAETGGEVPPMWTPSPQIENYDTKKPPAIYSPEDNAYKQVPLVGADGQPVKASEQNLTGPELKTKTGAEDKVIQYQSLSEKLEESLALSEKAFTGYGTMPEARANMVLEADRRAKQAGYSSPFSEETVEQARATQEWTATMKLFSAEHMAEVLKGSTAVQEMLYFSQILSNPNLDPSTRKTVTKQFQERLRAEIELNRSRAQQFGSSLVEEPKQQEGGPWTQYPPGDPKSDPNNWKFE